MRIVAFLLFFALGAATAQVTPKFSVKGQVVDIVTGTSIGNATVTLYNSDFGGADFKVTADQNGFFDVKGRRHLTQYAYADKEGYKWIPYPNSQKDFSSQITENASGEVEQRIIVRLTPLASLQVTVVDESGKPSDLVDAVLIRIDDKIPVFVPPIRIKAQKGRAEFNRVIDPGEYILRIEPRQETVATLQHDEWRYLSFYYPAETHRANAATIRFTAGENKAAVRLRLITAPNHAVRGRVTSAVPAREGQTMRVSIIPRLDDDPLLRQTVELTLPQGTFEIRRVPAGDYTVVAEVQEAKTNYYADDVYTPGKKYLVSSVIQVDRRDVEGLAFVVTPGLILKGHVVYEGHKPSPQVLGNMSVAVRSLAGPLPLGDGARLSDGDPFSLGPLSVGRYGVFAGIYAGEYFLKSVQLNGKILPTQEFEVVPGTAAGELEVVLSDRVGRIDALIADSESKPMTSGVLVFIYDGVSNRMQPYDVSQILIGHAGQYGKIGLGPGDYKLIAFEGITDSKSVTPELLAKHKKNVTVVHLDEAQKETVHLIAIKP